MAAAARGGWCCGHPRVVAGVLAWPAVAAMPGGCGHCGLCLGRARDRAAGERRPRRRRHTDCYHQRPWRHRRRGRDDAVATLATTRSRRPLRRTWTRGGGRLSRTTRSAWHAMTQRCWRGLRAASRRPRRAPTRLRRHPRFEVLADTDYRPVLAAGRCWRRRSRFEGGGGRRWMAASRDGSGDEGGRGKARRTQVPGGSGAGWGCGGPKDPPGASAFSSRCDDASHPLPSAPPGAILTNCGPYAAPMRWLGRDTRPTEA